MKFNNLFKIFFLSVLLVSFVSCKEDVAPDSVEVVDEVTFALSIDKIALEMADLRVRHDGNNDLKWVYMNTDDLETDADQLIDAVVRKQLDFAHEVLAQSGNNKSIRVSGLHPKSDYRLIVKAIDEAGNPYGKAVSLVFRTQRNLDVFEVNDNWKIVYEGRSEGVYPGSSELVEYDNFKCSSSDEESYILAVIKDADYKALQKHPDHKMKIRTFFEQYIASSGVQEGAWADVVKSGECVWQEQRLRHGEWILFMVGVDKEGALTGLYQQVNCEIPEEEPTEDFKKWLGKWNVVAYDQGIEFKFTLDILSSEANMWLYSIGWEPNNVYSIDPASLPVEIFYDKITGNAYLVSQYVSTAVDMTGAMMDFYFYGTFPYGGASTFVAADNTKIAEIVMTDDTNTEAIASGLVFTTNQAGVSLSFKYEEVIYYMTDGVNGTAISLDHPNFPFVMTKVTE